MRNQLNENYLLVEVDGSEAAVVADFAEENEMSFGEFEVATGITRQELRQAYAEKEPIFIPRRGSFYEVSRGVPLVNFFNRVH